MVSEDYIANTSTCLELRHSCCICNVTYPIQCHQDGHKEKGPLTGPQKFKNIFQLLLIALYSMM